MYLPYTFEELVVVLQQDNHGLSGEIIATYLRLLNDRAEALMAVTELVQRCPGMSVDLRCLTAAQQPRSAGAVCQILHVTGGGPPRTIGTGALVRGNLVLTAGHVVPPAIENRLPNAGHLVARFGYERECDGEVDSASVVDFDVRMISTEFMKGGLDYALLRANPTSGPQPGDVFPTMPLGASGSLVSGDALTCVHHPLGEPKQVSQGLFSHVAGLSLAYDIHTEFQSSGAPIMNQSGEIIAVHVSPSVSDPCVKLGTSSDAILAESTLL